MSMTEFRSYRADVAVAGFLICKPGTAGAVTLSTAATDKHIGAADSLDKAIGEMVDVGVGHIHEVRLGGTVAAGDALTSNASSKAITTTTTGNRIIGYAETAGVLDDVITYHRALGTI